MTDNNEYQNFIKDIQNFSKELKEQTNGEYSKITTKELLFFVISRFAELEDRINELEKENDRIKTVIKTMCVIIPIGIALISLILKIGVN